MSSPRCAVCKHFRRRCPPDCIFSPYFPPSDPQRFACVHEIYGASNIGKILQQVPVDQRAEAVDTLNFEAQCRKNDRVYGCVGLITLLQQEIFKTETELAKTRAEIACLLSAHNAAEDAQFHAALTTPQSNVTNLVMEEMDLHQSLYYPFSFWPVKKKSS